MKKLMLAKKNRLTTKKFQEVFKKGEVIHTPLFMGRKMFSVDKNSHFAVVVSKKIARRAVDRNKMRRRVYAEIENILPNISPPIQMIIFLKKEVANLTKKDFRKQLQKYLNSLY